MSKLILFLTFTFGFYSLYAQKNIIYSGRYTDIFKYRPDLNDTFRFEFYKNGALRTIEDKQFITITDLINPLKKDLNYTIEVDKYSRANEYDSFKTIYIYRDGINLKSVHFQKMAFQLSGGCFVYANKRTSYWYQTGFSIYEYDKYDGCIKQIDYNDFDGRRDTTIFWNKILYDDKKRITELKSYRGDTLWQTIKYQYKLDYQKTETFNSKTDLLNSIEEFSQDKKIIRSIEYQKYGSGGLTEINYFYNEMDLLEKEEHFDIKPNSVKELFQRRIYIYN